MLRRINDLETQGVHETDKSLSGGLGKHNMYTQGQTDLPRL
jgi:hypothetical protein